jgi:hypothetical protein
MAKDRVREAAREAWATVLTTEVGDSTDFFEVGGHSFLAIRIVALLDEALGTQVPLTLLFDHPCFADFVAAVEKEIAAGDTVATTSGE